MRNPKHKEDCGCRRDSRKWLELCPKHAAEHADMAARALADNARNPWPSDRQEARS